MVSHKVVYEQLKNIEDYLATIIFYIHLKLVSQVLMLHSV